MATNVLEVVFKGNDQGLGRMAGRMGKSIRTLGKVALGVGAAGFVALGAAFSDATELARIQINAEKQLDAVLKSTGGAAGLTAQEIKDMASALQNVTNFGDEAIIAGQNLLLTFTNIGKDVFPEATEIMLDMSQALGQDMKSSAVQLGKALNDPVLGITALSRVGVSFTQDQKDMIAAMVEMGDVAGAQTIILEELQKEFGGSAQALADPAIQLSNAWGDFKEQVGGVMLSVINPLAQRALPFLQQAMADVLPVFDALSHGFEVFFTAVGGGVPFVDALKNAVSAFLVQLGFSGEALTNVRNKIQLFFDKLSEVGAKISEVVQPIADWIAKNTELSDWLTTLAIVIGGVLLSAVVSIIAAMAPLIITIGLIVGAVALLREAWERDFLGIRTTITEWADEHGGIMEGIKAWWGDLMVTWEQLAFIIGIGAEIVKNWWEDLKVTWEQTKTIIALGVEFLQEKWTNFKNLITGLVDQIKTIWDGLAAKFQAVKDGIVAALQPIIDLIEEIKGALSSIELPDWMTPGSPTPWEIGLKGVRNQMALLNTRELPGLQANLQGFNQSGASSSRTVNDNRVFNWNVNTASFNPESAGRSAAAFSTGGI